MKNIRDWWDLLTKLQKIMIPAEIIILILASSISILSFYGLLVFLLLLPFTLNWEKSSKLYLLFGVITSVITILNFQSSWNFLKWIITLFPENISNVYLYEGHPSPLGILFLPFWGILGVIIGYFVGMLLKNKK